MSGSIPRNFIDDLLTRVDIVDIIDSRVTLKKAGKDYKACCPFHNEKTPSFTVSRNKQLYHCFGCGASGSVISFLMDYENLEFVEAVTELAKSVGLEVPFEKRGKQQIVKASAAPNLYEIMERVNRYYINQLKNHPEKSAIVDYLKQRGISGVTAKNFELGFSPPGWRNLLDAFRTHPGEADMLVDTGMLIKKDEGQTYDRFRERLMFPIRDRRGRVIAFGGRVITDGTPKYLNSPETDIFHKGQELYGLYQALKHQESSLRLIVVEGYMDVVSLAEHDVNNAVATLGTAISETHIQTLSKRTGEVIFCFDGDQAGKKAAWRALETVLPYLGGDTQYKFLFLAEGEDPDTTVQQTGTDGFNQLLSNADALSDFLLESLLQKSDFRSIDGQAKLIELARPLIEKVPKGSYTNLLVSRLSEKVNLSSDEMLRRIFPKQRSNRQNQAVKPVLTAEKPSTVRLAIAMLLEQPDLALQVEPPERFRNLQLPGIALLEKLLVFIHNRPHIKTGAILDSWQNQEEIMLLRKILHWEHHVPESGIASEFVGAIESLDLQLKQQTLEKLFQQSKVSPLTPEEKAQLSQLISETSATRH